MLNTHESRKPLAKQFDKYEQLLTAAYGLFLEQGFEAVTIQEIAMRAGVAKGTFYLYFRDKEELKEQLITQISKKLFREALDSLHKTKIKRFDEQIIFVVDYIIDLLDKNKPALKLIAKNLSFGMFNDNLSDFLADDDVDVMKVLITAAEKSKIKLKNPRVLLFMIIELVSSTCFSCILTSRPLEISAYKPYLYSAIRELIHANTEKSGFFSYKK